MITNALTTLGVYYDNVCKVDGGLWSTVKVPYATALNFKLCVRQLLANPFLAVR